MMKNLIKDVLNDYLNYCCSDDEKVFLETFFDSFIDCNYENCAYAFRDFLKSIDSYTSIIVEYDFERELFLNE